MYSFVGLNPQTVKQGSQEKDDVQKLCNNVCVARIKNGIPSFNHEVIGQLHSSGIVKGPF